MWGNWYWPLWLSASVIAFLVAESYALATNPNNTLSDWVWRVLHIARHESFFAWNAADYLVFGVWVVLVSWLTFHFFLRLFA